MNCCTNTYNLGCFSYCDCVEMPFTWSGGPNVLVIESVFADAVSRWEFGVEDGNSFCVPNNFNESGITKFIIKDLEGNILTFDTYDCFKVKVSPLVNKTEYNGMHTTSTVQC